MRCSPCDERWVHTYLRVLQVVLLAELLRQLTRVGAWEDVDDAFLPIGLRARGKERTPVRSAESG